MKHFNIDKIALVESITGDDNVKFCYGEQDFLIYDFKCYTAKLAISDLEEKSSSARFKRAVFLHQLLITASEKMIACYYHNYNKTQLAAHGTITITAVDHMSFTLNINITKNIILFKTARFAHNEIASLKRAESHAKGQMGVLKDYQELLDEVNVKLKEIGPKIDKLFK